MDAGDYVAVLITASDEDEAAGIARALVGERLAACVNIVRGVRSIYRWQGDVHDEQECLMLAKTTRNNFQALEARVKELHSYSVPEVIALPIVAGHEPYLKWLEENTLLG